MRGLVSRGDCAHRPASSNRGGTRALRRASRRSRENAWCAGRASPFWPTSWRCRSLGTRRDDSEPASRASAGVPDAREPGPGLRTL